MFGVVVALIAVGEDTANHTLKLFGPCLSWIAKWLPLFYVASLVTLPLSLNGIPGETRLIFGVQFCMHGKRGRAVGHIGSRDTALAENRKPQRRKALAALICFQLKPRFSGI